MKKLEKILQSVKKKLLNSGGYVVVRPVPIEAIQNQYPKLTEDECGNLLKQSYRSQKIKGYRRT